MRRRQRRATSALAPSWRNPPLIGIDLLAAGLDCSLDERQIASSYRSAEMDQRLARKPTNVSCSQGAGEVEHLLLPIGVHPAELLTKLVFYRRVHRSQPPDPVSPGSPRLRRGDPEIAEQPQRRTNLCLMISRDSFRAQRV